MTAADHEAELRSAAGRLDEISKLLAGDELEDSAAVELAREAAQIAADVGTIAADAARAAAEGGDGA